MTRKPMRQIPGAEPRLIGDLNGPPLCPPHLYRLLDGLAMGVLLVDARGRIRYANLQAERLLQRHDGLCVSDQHDLRAHDPQEQAELRKLLESAIRASRCDASASAAGGVLACHTGQDGGLLMVTVAPLSEITGYEGLSRDGIAAAILLADPRARHRLPTALLKRSFGLTDRETDLCEAFLNSPTLEGVATACHLSLSSVRTYMKEIYAKTGRRSQAELMHLLMGLRLDFGHIR